MSFIPNTSGSFVSRFPAAQDRDVVLEPDQVERFRLDLDYRRNALTWANLIAQQFNCDVNFVSKADRRLLETVRAPAAPTKAVAANG